MSSIDPFFGDGDNRDSDGEDFEEEAALLNESGGVSQPKDVILGDPFAAVDQKSVLLEKVRKPTNRKGKSLEEVCWLVFVGESLAIGGEWTEDGQHVSHAFLSRTRLIGPRTFTMLWDLEPAIQVPQNFQVIQKCLPDDFKISKDTVTEDWALTNCLELLQIGVTQSTEAKEAKEELKQLKHGMVKGDGLRLAAKLERRALDMLFVLKGADPTTEWRKKGKMPIVVLEDGSMHIKMR
ncbi:hypothetical protein IV203_019287 [Nitzschia inconspicua]|uniref:Uncharacterized protein n=1 Tax=Nitzschia inconspicua TaxID=303405 RepID=A0A9K3LYW8_9STRA|nr:hypothetical protein IV203_019287 [Nitzschia inconspicua]